LQLQSKPSPARSCLSNKKQPAALHRAEIPECIAKITTFLRDRMDDFRDLTAGRLFTYNGIQSNFGVLFVLRWYRIVYDANAPARRLRQ
jgi:hypothetical protein